MSDQRQSFPDNWRIAGDYDPNQHLLKLKGKDYLDVQNRLIWYVRDQRELIMRGLATHSYMVRTELVSETADWAEFRTTVRDVLGNEATMYGSESQKDFPDFREKASTKSLGRALVMLGYGTSMAPELDEGERVVDSPVKAQASPERPQNAPRPLPTRPMTSPSAGTIMATDQQLRAIRNMCEKLGRAVPDKPLTTEEAAELIAQLGKEKSA